MYTLYFECLFLKDASAFSLSISILYTCHTVVDPNGNFGTDHGWGNNLWVAGGDLEGGKILGQYPDDLTNANQYIYSGITIPTTPLDSVWNSIAEWMGVTSEDDLNMVVPNRNSFSDLWDINVLYGDGS